MKLVLCSLVVLTFVAVFGLDADKSSVELDTNDVLDEKFYGLDSSENEDSDSDSGEEDETTTLSPRSRGRFSHRQRGGKSGRHSHKTKSWRKTMTPDEKFQSICRTIKSKSNMQSRKMSMKLRRLDAEVREKFQAAVTARTEAMSECCILNGTEGIQCAENIRTQRYTRVCSGEEPLSICSTLKGKGTSSESSEIVTRCCALEGEERNSCFLASKPKQFSRYNGKHRRN